MQEIGDEYASYLSGWLERKCQDMPDGTWAKKHLEMMVQFGKNTLNPPAYWFQGREDAEVHFRNCQKAVRKQALVEYADHLGGGARRIGW